MQARISRQIQRGIAGALIIIVILLAAVAIVLGRGFQKSDVDLEQRAATKAALGRISDALVAYATLNKRLPCAAAGNSTTGDADPVGAAATCNSPAGVVPWITLGLRREDTLDGWGRRISYRVYSGNTGFTQTDGVSMTDCNTNALATGNTVDAQGKCLTSPARYTTPAAFLAGKGLTATNEVGSTTGGLAFLLASHGENGAGAYLADGSGRVALPPSGGRQYSNTQVAAPFGIGSPSPVGTLQSDPTYFDDVVLTMAADELIRAARLTARDWGDPTPAMLASITVAAQSFKRTDLAAVLGFTPGNNTGLGTIDFGAFSVTAHGSTARNISSGIGTSGEGIGAIGTGTSTMSATTINSATSEFLDFHFDTVANYLGITLVDFGIFSGAERVRFEFYAAGSLLATINKSACSATSSGNVLANFVLNPGTTFDQLKVIARTTTTAADSMFTVGTLRTCNAALVPCTAPAAIPANDCP